MKIKLNTIKPHPINDEIYDVTDLTKLKLSLEDNGQLEPLNINMQNIIISGHRRYYAMKQLGWKECEVLQRKYDNDIIGLIEHNRSRQKTEEDNLREYEFLTKEIKKTIGRGKRTDLDGGKARSSDKEAVEMMGTLSYTALKQLKSIKNYMPELLTQINEGKISRGKAYSIVQVKHINKDKKEKSSDETFVKRFTKLLKDLQPPSELIFQTMEGIYPYSKEKVLTTEISKDKTPSKFDAKRDEFISHLEFLKKLDSNRELLYKKIEEIDSYGFKKELLKKIEKNLWIPKNMNSPMEMIEEIDALEPILEIVEGDTEEFNVLRVNISTMQYYPNKGRHIRVIVKDKKSKKYLGCIVLASDYINVGVRDEFIGWSKVDRNGKNGKNGRLRNTAVASTLVPVQPFGFNFLGGKLIASLSTSSTIRDEWKKRYGDTLVAITTTSLYGNYSMYDRIPYWKNLGKTKGRYLLHPSKEQYQYWLDYVRENYRKEYDEAVNATSPKQKILNLIYRVVGITASKYQNEFQRGVYLSVIYKNGKEFLRNEIKEDDLIMDEKFVKDVDAIMEWWRPKAVRRYENLRKKNDLNEYTLWHSHTKKEDVDRYNSLKGLYGE